MPGTRAELAQRIGAADERVAEVPLELLGTTQVPSLIAQCERYDVRAVRWPVLPGVDGEGLLLRPHAAARAHVVAVPDAAQSPEAVCGLTGDLPEWSQFARASTTRGNGS